VYVPEEHPWSWEERVRLRDYAGYSVKLVDAHVMRVRVRFEAGGRVPWVVHVDDFSG
jgi:hypothetical protein